MGNLYEAKCAICCFYKGEAVCRIICEGLYEDSTVHMSFPTRAVMKLHKNKYCYSWDYESCPWAKLMGEKYAKAEEKAAETGKESGGESGGAE